MFLEPMLGVAAIFGGAYYLRRNADKYVAERDNTSRQLTHQQEMEKIDAVRTLLESKGGQEYLSRRVELARDLAQRIQDPDDIATIVDKTLGKLDISKYNI